MGKGSHLCDGQGRFPISDRRRRVCSALLRALRDGVERSAKGLLRQRLRWRRFLFFQQGRPGRRSRCQAKIGGMVPLWPLWTLWLAYFAARGVMSDDAPLKCEDLRIGQYICEHPKIDNATQEPMKCTNHTAYVACLPAPNITCKDFSGNETQFTGNETGFYKPIECRSVNGYSYKVAVALSLFLGWLGADRFYLGYPALGLLKFCTVGFCGIGSLIDFILISMQIVGPSDGSNYIIDYYGARLTRLSITNDTYRKPQMYP